MEEAIKKFDEDKRDQEIVYSKAIKAGKRIYYLDVKRNRKDELFLAITESKKKIMGEDAQISFEKHKIFLYKEDFAKFKDGLEEVIEFINQHNDNQISGSAVIEDQGGNEKVGDKFKIDFG